MFLAALFLVTSAEWDIAGTFFSHFCYLVAGVHIVMFDAISPTDVSNA